MTTVPKDGTPAPAAPAPPGAKALAERGLPLTVTLALSLAALVTVSLTVVLGIGLWSARKNTFELLSDKADLVLSSAIGHIDDHLEPAEHQVRFISELIDRGALDPGDRARFSDHLLAALAAAPQIRALVFIDTDHQLIGAERAGDGARAYTADYSGDATVREGVAATAGLSGMIWAEPVWRSRFERTILNLRQPVRRHGVYLGLLVAAVTVEALSERLAGLSGLVGSNAFILYDREHVLAHAFAVGRYPGLSVEQPLPPLAGFADPVLSAIWRVDGSRPLVIPLRQGAKGHWVSAFNEQYVFIYREINRYGGRPWQVGAYFRSADVDSTRERLRWSAIAGLVAMALSCLIAALLARRITRPIIRLADAAARIGQLEISEVADLPASGFRELNRQAAAFNAMLRGLRWFETYVPRTLVRRLVRQGDLSGLDSAEREVTVMFTDIAGFTSLSEGKPAAEVAAFLNEHFALIAAAVEAEEGTVDKFIGDSVMAFWGAPEAQEDHAARAARAALAAAAAQREDNVARRSRGLAPVRLRIGLHSGPVTVGNIGAPGRINYTIIGDTVNVGQRLEQLGKTLYPEDTEVTILLSEDTASRLGPGLAPQDAGPHAVPGRKEPIRVFKLD